MGNGKGYEVDPDKMREAIKLAESMLEELEERAYEVPDLVGMPAPSTQEDKVTNEYHNGQKVGARTSAVATAQAYHEAFQGQMQYLSQLIPNLQSALSSYEQSEESIGESMRSKQNQVQ
ncbi:hypothetical protein [Thermocrispum municipale]|jgi:hypothetical protein|uniref:hypothetical protein n=1 Tax=Thermocrispum municipale TaxID=37926 RepID=UPI00040F3CD9|nr:hypothetical protein [Thermocrispum municipale]